MADITFAFCATLIWFGSSSLSPNCFPISFNHKNKTSLTKRFLSDILSFYDFWDHNFALLTLLLSGSCNTFPGQFLFSPITQWIKEIGAVSDNVAAECFFPLLFVTPPFCIFSLTLLHYSLLTLTFYVYGWMGWVVGSQGGVRYM